MFNTDPHADKCEAVVSIVVGQAVVVHQPLKVLHANETLVHKVQEQHVSGMGMEELRKKLHELVDRHVDSYCDFVNGA